MLQKMLKDFIYEIYNLNETQNNIFQDLKYSIAFHFLVFGFCELCSLGQNGAVSIFTMLLLVRCYYLLTIIFWLDATDHI